MTGEERIEARKGERIVRCPTCGGDSVYSERNPYRPFCSARCKGIDLGAWASEEFRMPAEAPRRRALRRSEGAAVAHSTEIRGLHYLPPAGGASPRKILST